jgi:hypothetical protein
MVQSSLPSNGGSLGGSSALITEMRALRGAFASGNAQIAKAIADNTPVIQGSFMDDIKVYKSSQAGKRKANFIVSPT